MERNLFSNTLGVTMNYKPGMNSAFKTLQDNICMWRDILFDERFSDFYELVSDVELWTPSPAPEDLIRQLYDGIDDVEHGYTLNVDDDQESKPRHIRVLRRYDLQSHVSRAKMPLRKCDVILFATYVSERM